jgi:bifunctional ADP-heptose synthase (sugar kinase/adenylyltransferase)
MLVCEERKPPRKIPTMAQEVYDVSGAGDTVISVAALMAICTDDIRLIAEVSNIAGGLVCEKVGVVPVDKDQLLKESIRILSA